MNKPIIKGACLCGQVKYEYHAEITEIAVCHCNQCKQAQGTPFVTNAVLDASQFNLTAGKDQIRAFASSSAKRRVFCQNCGSPLYSYRTDLPGIIRLRVGTVIEGQLPKPSYQSFCDAESTWLDLSDIPRFPQKPTAASD